MRAERAEYNSANSATRFFILLLQLITPSQKQDATIYGAGICVNAG